MTAASGNFPIYTRTVVLAVAILANRFTKRDGNLPTAGGNALGVTRFDGLAGDAVSVDVIGTAIAECAAAVAADDALMVDATGRVLPLAGSAKQSVGRALEAGSAAGAKIEILLIPSAGLVTA